MEGISEFSGKPYPAETPPGNAPTSGPDLATFDPWMGYFQLSRFKFVDTAGDVAAHLDLESEQKIMKVEVDRGACCHVAGDIDFDRGNNLWLVTGDDTPAGSVNVQQFPPFNDMKTNETQNLAAPAGATGTFTLTFDGRTTARSRCRSTTRRSRRRSRRCPTSPTWPWRTPRAAPAGSTSAATCRRPTCRR